MMHAHTPHHHSLILELDLRGGVGGGVCDTCTYPHHHPLKIKLNLRDGGEGM